MSKLSTEQDLVNIQIANWVARNLAECGYPTRPVDSSWGVLYKKDWGGHYGWCEQSDPGGAPHNHCSCRDLPKKVKEIIFENKDNVYK